jgi:IstB-like ATP binding protein
MRFAIGLCQCKPFFLEMPAAQSAAAQADGTHRTADLDELGFLPFSKAGVELLFDFISSAYERTCVIITMNLPFEIWTVVLRSERLTGAMLDRLTQRMHILEANGESYWLKDAKARLNRR